MKLDTCLYQTLDSHNVDFHSYDWLTLPTQYSVSATGNNLTPGKRFKN